MTIIEKAKIEKILDFAEEHFGEWKIVIQKNSEGKLRCHTSFPTDIVDEPQVMHTETIAFFSKM